MTRNAAGHFVFPYLGTFQGTGGSVVYLGAAMEPLLKFIGILSNVMAHSQEETSLLLTKLRCKAAAKGGGFLQVGCNGLFSPVRGDVRQIWMGSHRYSSF